MTKLITWIRTPIGVALGLGLLVGFLIYLMFEHRISSRLASVKADQLHSNVVLVEIDGVPITEGAVNFEMEIHRRALGSVTSESGQVIADQTQSRNTAVDSTDVNEAELESSLRDFVVSGLIERKTLLSYFRSQPGNKVKADSIYTPTCLAEWQSQIDGEESSWIDEKGKVILKDMLCERSAVSETFEKILRYDESDLNRRAKAYFDENADEFSEPEKVQIRQIVLATESEAKTAQEGLTRLNFAERARSHSISPDGKNGGLLPPFSMGYMSSALDVAFEMQVGAIFGIVKSPYGFHIILLEKVIPRRNPNFDTAKPRIIEVLRAQDRANQYEQLLTKAKKLVKIDTKRGSVQ